MRKRQDWGLWLKIMKECKIAYGMKEPFGYLSNTFRFYIT